MRYFEWLRRSLRPENGRCGQQAKYRIEYLFGKDYSCQQHVWDLVEKRNEKGVCADGIYQMAYGEITGCDYETTV